MNKYKPRRASAKWLDGDCPAGVMAIFDHKKFGDRYTVFYMPTDATTYAQTSVEYRGMSENPTSPLGMGQWGEMSAHDCAMYRHSQNHKRCKWSDLPDAVKALVRADLAPERLEIIRKAIEAENISYDQLHELQTIAASHPELVANDSLLAELAGLPES